MEATELDELERLAKAATPGPYVYNGHPFTLDGPDAEYAIALANAAPRLIAAARRQGALPPEPEPLDVERLARTLQAIPHSTEIRSLYGEQLSWAELGDSNRQKKLRDAAAIAAEYARLSEPAQPETER